MLRKRLHDKEEEKKDRDEYLKQTLKSVKDEQKKEIEKERMQMGERIKEVK